MTNIVLCGIGAEAICPTWIWRAYNEGLFRALR